MFEDLAGNNPVTHPPCPDFSAPHRLPCTWKAGAAPSRPQGHTLLQTAGNWGFFHGHPLNIRNQQVFAQRKQKYRNQLKHLNMENQRELGGKRLETKGSGAAWEGSCTFHCSLTTGLRPGPRGWPRLRTRLLLDRPPNLRRVLLSGAERLRQDQVRAALQHRGAAVTGVVLPATFMLKEPFSRAGGPAGLSSWPLPADTWP